MNFTHDHIAGAHVPPSGLIAAYILARFQEVEAGNAVCENFVLGLRTILMGVADPAFRGPEPALIDIERRLFPAALSVVEEMGERLDAPEVHLALAACSGLLAQLRKAPTDREATALTLARIDHVGLLANAVDDFVRRRRLETGGDLIRRSFKIAAARDAKRGSAPLN